MKELLRRAFEAGMYYEWSLNLNNNLVVKPKPSFKEWYKEQDETKNK